MRDSHNKINKPGDNCIYSFSHCCGQNAQNKGHHRAESRGADSNDNADGKPFNRPGKHVSSQPVGSKRIFQAGSNIFTGKISFSGSISAEHSANTYSSQKYQGKRQPQYQPLPAVPFFHHKRSFFSVFCHFAAPPRLIRGSITPYRIFAMRFPPKTNKALIMVIAIRRGMSLPSPALTAACPSPG